MKLFYYKDPIGNFGDDLNPWLWDKLLPDFCDEDESEWLVGIGTLLNHKLPTSGRKIVLGSGYGYGTPPKIDDSFRILSVRGPKTAETLGIDSNLAITDPAILIRCVHEVGNAERSSKFGFIPHCDSVTNFSWETLCAEAGVKFINVQWSVDRFLAAMAECDVLICEAMHGAIVADALRIPWIPVRCYSYIDSFKWQDWLATVKLPYEPVSIAPLFDAETKMPPAQKTKNKLKRALKTSGIWNPNWSSPEPAPSKPEDIDKAQTDLQSAMLSPQFLSEEAVCAKLTDQYLEVLEQTKRLK